MSRAFQILLVAGLVAAFVVNLPDLKRYIRISTM